MAAARVVDLCLEAGLTMFDSADIYSAGQAKEILFLAIKRRRGQVIISTKGAFRFSDQPDDVGSGRKHLTKQIEGSLRRLGTDYIDLYQLARLRCFDAGGRDARHAQRLRARGKIRQIGCSHFSGWHLMKSLALDAR